MSVGIRIDASSGAPCAIEFERVSLISRSQHAEAARLPPPLRLAPSSALFVPVILPFDSSAAWDQGDRAALVSVALRVDGTRVAPFEWSVIP
jgi:hypothetical protein